MMNDYSLMSVTFVPSFIQICSALLMITFCHILQELYSYLFPVFILFNHFVSDCILLPFFLFLKKKIIVRVTPLHLIIR